MAEYDHPLNDKDCADCIQIVTFDHARTKAELERIQRMGFPLPNIAEENDANLVWAKGVLKECFPNRYVPENL